MKENRKAYSRKIRILAALLFVGAILIWWNPVDVVMPIRKIAGTIFLPIQNFASGFGQTVKNSTDLLINIGEL